MMPLYYLRHLQNSLNFVLRNQVRFRRQPRLEDLRTTTILKLQEELEEFLGLFDWTFLAGATQRRGIFTAADVGALDFSFAPVFEKHFQSLGLAAVAIHGIEIDAYRRYSNFYSRADYGRAFASQIRRGSFHALDFLKFQQPLDFIFLLHPFVTPEPSLRWGLPLSVYKPQAIFDHCRDLLKGRRGTLLLSNPSEGEFENARKRAVCSGFVIQEQKIWQPRETTAHQKPRYGAVLSLSGV